jgi:photosystem II stability/assembly factor-like uncharacterized protein
LIHDGEFGGVFTSDTRGASWQQLNAGLGGRDVNSLLAITSPEWRLLAGTPDGIFEYSFDHPTWKNHSRWEGATSSKETIAVRDLFRRNATGPIYAATSAGLFESTDGRAWKRLPFPGSPGGVYAVASFGEEGEKLLAASSVKLAVSHDRGRNWTPVPLDGDGPVRIHEIAPNPSLPDVLFAATDKGLFRSRDGGRSWSKNGRGLPAASLHDVSVSVGNPTQVVVAGASGAFYSADGGEWFARFGEPALSDGLAAGFTSLQILPDSSVIVVSPHNGLFLQDGQSFRLPRVARSLQ